jgi:predicted HAD superfamily phosphohydrolase
VRVRGPEHRADPLEQLGRDVVAAALGAEHVLQLALEVGVPRARIATTEMALDLDALEPNELTVEVELDLSEHVFAVSR